MCGSPAGQDFGAEEVGIGYLTVVCATFLGVRRHRHRIPASTHGGSDALPCSQLDAPTLLG